MAIDPERSVPRDVATVQSLQSTTEESAKAAMRAPVEQAMGNARGSLFGNLLGFIVGGIGNALRGIFTPGGLFAPVGEAAQEIRDGQLDLLDRVDLLEGIQGYCAAYQDVNINVEWSSDNWRDIPFKKQLGPAKNITVNTSNGTMRLHHAGLFVVYAKIHANATSFTGGDYGYLVIEVHRPGGGVYSRGHMEKVIPRSREQTLSMSWPIVVPGEGYTVKVRAYSANWRWWRGGTQYATLHIIQHSNDSQNLGQSTVPDETR